MSKLVSTLYKILIRFGINKHQFLILFLALCALCPVPGGFAAHAAGLTLAWDANDEPDLAGYRLHYGTSSGSYSTSVDVGNTRQHTFTGLDEGVTYYFAATAYDNNDNESGYSEEISYAVSSPNSPPDTPAIPSGPINGFTQTGYSYNTYGTDPDNDVLVYRFDWGDGQISNWGMSSQTHSWPADGNYCVKAQAKDENSAVSEWSACRNLTIAMTTRSYTITAAASANGSISPSGSVEVNAGAGQTFSINPDQNYRVADVIVDGVSRGEVNSYTFGNVTQNHTISASFALDNHPPTADAGPDKTVKSGVIVRLSALGSTDPDDGIAGYSWKQTKGKAVTLSNPKDPEPVFVSPAVSLENETLSFELTVTDHGGLKDVDSCTALVVNSAGIDSDGDGVTDDQDAFPDDPNEWQDTDGDNMGNNADADDDNDGLTDTDEIQKYGTDPLHPDSDGDGYDDSEEIQKGTDPLDPNSMPSSIQIEIGEIEVNHIWTRVDFEKSFIEPIVVSGSYSLNDKDPGVIRIRNVDSTGFDIRIQEWEYLDGHHATETVYYIVVERGVYSLADGTRVEADRFETNKINQFESVSFVQTFQKIPVVISSITSINEADAVTGRAHNISLDGYQYCMQEQELNNKTHSAETVNYIAWEPSENRIGNITFEIGITGNEVSHKLSTIHFNQSFATTPILLVDMQTANNLDTANVRWQNSSRTSAQVQIDEEQSLNKETRHRPETVGYMVFSK